MFESISWPSKRSVDVKLKKDGEKSSIGLCGEAAMTKKEKMIKCYYCCEVEHTAAQCRRPAIAVPIRACFICGCRDHLAKDCPRRVQTERRPGNLQQSSSESEELTENSIAPTGVKTVQQFPSELEEKLQLVHKSITQTRAEQVFERCMGENNMTRSDWITENEIVTDVHTKPENAEKKRNNGCAVTCILKNLDLMDESNDFNESQVHVEISNNYGDSILPIEGKIHKIANKCMKEAKPITEECDKGFTLYACLCRVVHKLERHEDYERGENKAEENENNNERNSETNNAQE